jgi:hypothetical protein
MGGTPKTGDTVNIQAMTRIAFLHGGYDSMGHLNKKYIITAD